MQNCLIRQVRTWLMASCFPDRCSGCRSRRASNVPHASLHLCLLMEYRLSTHRGSPQISYYFVFSCFGTSECWRFSKTPAVIRTGDKKMQPHGKKIRGKDRIKDSSPSGHFTIKAWCHLHYYILLGFESRQKYVFLSIQLLMWGQKSFFTQYIKLKLNK